MPFFSIIIPLYNRARLIEATLNSVFAQTFTDFEVIVVDDGSTDDSAVVVSKYTDPRLRYHYQENGERGKARNRGVAEAEGDYVFFLDSDDLIYPNHLQVAYDTINRLGYPAFFHSRYEELIGDEKRQVPSLNKATIYRQICRQNKFACQFYLKRTIASEFPFSENRNLKIGEDWEVVLKVAQRYTLYFTNDVTAAIVHHGERTMEIAKVETIIESRDILIENLKKDRLISDEVLKNVYAELTTLAGLSAAISGEKSKAYKYLFRGIKKRGRQLFKRRTLAIIKKTLFNAKA